jgi:hypothetical protein
LGHALRHLADGILQFFLMRTTGPSKYRICEGPRLYIPSSWERIGKNAEELGTEKTYRALQLKLQRKPKDFFS